VAVLDSRLIAFIIWGLGVVAVYGFVLWRRHHSWTLHHDTRSRRDLVEAFGLFLVSLSAATSIGATLFGEVTIGARALLTATSLGAFLGVGLVMATEPGKQDPAEPDDVDEST